MTVSERLLLGTHAFLCFLGIAADRGHALSVAELPWPHGDPFDRLLVAQAHAEDLRIVSRDEAFDDYGVSRIW